MSQENIEVKVAKLEAKVDTVLERITSIDTRLSEISIDAKGKVSRQEFDEFKTELKANRFKQTILTAVFTCVITTLVGYVVIDVLGR
jgi:hypothetical protein